MPFQHSARTLARSAASMMVALLVAGCGSGGGGGLPTALPDPSTAAATGAAPGASSAAGSSSSPVPSGLSTDPAVAWPAYAACLRSHGVDTPDPVIDENGDASWGSGFEVKDHITRPIEKDCGPLISALTKSGGKPRHSYTYESEVAHSACLRDHGLTSYPDPDPDNPGRLAPGYDKGDPAVFAALTACESVLIEQTASPSPAG